MILGYKKRKLSLNLPSDLYEQLKKIALKMDWTEKKTLGWAIALGANVVDKSDEMEKELSELISRKNELNQELESITPDYGKLSSRNAAFRYKYFEVFSGNKTLAIKLTGAKTMNGSFKNALKIANRYNEQEDQADIEMVEKYVPRRNFKISKQKRIVL